MRETQNSFLLKYMRKYTITTLEAHRFGICRLSERIRELQKSGYMIGKRSIKVRSRGGYVTVTEYVML